MWTKLKPVNTKGIICIQNYLTTFSLYKTLLLLQTHKNIESFQSAHLFSAEDSKQWNRRQAESQAYMHNRPQENHCLQLASQNILFVNGHWLMYIQYVLNWYLVSAWSTVIQLFLEYLAWMNSSLIRVQGLIKTIEVLHAAISCHAFCSTAWLFPLFCTYSRQQHQLNTTQRALPVVNVPSWIACTHNYYDHFLAPRSDHQYSTKQQKDTATSLPLLLHT